MIQIKRVYEPASREDGCRVLVDRLWPRGLSKESARTHAWLKEIAPSDALRKWFGHEPSRFARFKKRYAAELKTKPDLIEEVRRLEREHKTLTLLYAAKDESRNNAAVLKELLSPRES